MPHKVFPCVISQYLKKALFRHNFRESYLSDTNTKVKALSQIPYHEILPIKVSGEKKVEEKRGCHRRWGMGKSWTLNRRKVDRRQKMSGK